MKVWQVVAKLYPKKTFCAHFLQVNKLGPSPHVRLNFAKKNVKCLLSNFEWNEGLFVKIWLVVVELSLKNHFSIWPKSSCWAPTQIQDPSSLDGLNSHTRKLPSVGPKILNKIRGCLWKSDKWLPSYVIKPISDPFGPNLCTRSQSPCKARFSLKKKFGKCWSWNVE